MVHVGEITPNFVKHFLRVNHNHFNYLVREMVHEFLGFTLTHFFTIDDLYGVGILWVEGIKKSKASDLSDRFGSYCNVRRVSRDDNIKSAGNHSR